MNTEIFDELDLLPYQSAFAANDSRFKIGLWARQTGKDHTATLEAVADCMSHPGATWIVLAAGERQALESIAKAKEWARMLHMEMSGYDEAFGQDGRARRTSGALLTRAEIRWRNGSRFIALPAKPETARGYSANLILTEFAFHEDPEGLWRAIYPSISNSLRGGKKKLRIISTPNGLGNKFADLWHNGEGYSKHFTDIHAAIADGLALDVEELRRGLNDPEAWAQEYECRFADASAVLLPYELIASCESAEAMENSSPEALSARASLSGGPRGELYVGIDFGRKEHLTVAWTLERIGTQMFTREVLALKGRSTPEQLEILRPRLALAHRAAIDYTGGGIGLGDHLVQEFGEWNAATHRGGKVELCQFTAALKGELFPRLRTAFEKQELRIPISRAIREDLHGIHRAVSQSGAITYRAAYSPDGHSDRCTALALALRAASSAPRGACARSISVPGRTANLAWALHRRVVL